MIKLLEKKEKKRLDNSFKKSVKQFKKLSKEELQKVYETYNDQEDSYKNLRNKLQHMLKQNTPGKFIQEWQEFNKTAYAHYLKIEIIKELKKKT